MNLNLSSFYRGGLANELRAICLQICLDCANTAEADRHAFLALKKPIMGQRLADFHDLNVLIIHFPQLAFCQWRYWGLFELHTFYVIWRFALLRKKSLAIVTAVPENRVLNLLSTKPLKHLFDEKGIEIFIPHMWYNQRLKAKLTAFLS